MGFSRTLTRSTHWLTSRSAVTATISQIISERHCCIMKNKTALHRLTEYIGALALWRQRLADQCVTASNGDALFASVFELVHLQDESPFQRPQLLPSLAAACAQLTISLQRYEITCIACINPKQPTSRMTRFWLPCLTFTLALGAFSGYWLPPSSPLPLYWLSLQYLGSATVLRR